MKTGRRFSRSVFVVALETLVSVASLAAAEETQQYTLRVDAGGKGEGAVVVMTKLAYDEETERLELEAFGQQPVRLTNVERRD